MPLIRAILCDIAVNVYLINIICLHYPKRMYFDYVYEKNMHDNTMWSFGMVYDMYDIGIHCVYEILQLFHII